jgi:hypothetical protein
MLSAASQFTKREKRVNKSRLLISLDMRYVFEYINVYRARRWASIIHTRAYIAYYILSAEKCMVALESLKITSRTTPVCF